MEDTNKEEVVEKEKAEQSVGEIIDGILNDPTFMMKQVGRISKESQEALKKLTDTNKQLEDEKIKKDKEIEYLEGKIDGMEYVIEHFNKGGLNDERNEISRRA